MKDDTTNAGSLEGLSQPETSLGGAAQPRGICPDLDPYGADHHLSDKRYFNRSERPNEGQRGLGVYGNKIAPGSIFNDDGA